MEILDSDSFIDRSICSNRLVGRVALAIARAARESVGNESELDRKRKLPSFVTRCEKLGLRRGFSPTSAASTARLVDRDLAVTLLSPRLLPRSLALFPRPLSVPLLPSVVSV